MGAVRVEQRSQIRTVAGLSGREQQDQWAAAIACAAGNDGNFEIGGFDGWSAGLDSGSLYAGPVDAALADVAELLGDLDAATRWRAAASDLVTLVSERLRERGPTAFR
ncbi:hypothetical protein ACGFIU_18685 [Rhodococcus oryzae]|uniref:hypothetical protein n=1 Tax=Rhodococcus oryzae TaxID=2571143 RepID=UPI00371095D2